MSWHADSLMGLSCFLKAEHQVMLLPRFLRWVVCSHQHRLPGCKCELTISRQLSSTLCWTWRRQHLLHHCQLCSLNSVQREQESERSVCALQEAMVGDIDVLAAPQQAACSPAGIRVHLPCHGQLSKPDLHCLQAAPLAALPWSWPVLTVALPAAWLAAWRRKALRERPWMGRAVSPAQVGGHFPVLVVMSGSWHQPGGWPSSLQPGCKSQQDSLHKGSRVAEVFVWPVLCRPSGSVHLKWV